MSQETTPINTFPRYEVVFFVKFSESRPDATNIANYFTKYGDIAKVVCPNDKPYAFIFVAKLNSNLEHRRVRLMIEEIRGEMEPPNYFTISVARNNRRHRHDFRTQRPNYAGQYNRRQQNNADGYESRNTIFHGPPSTGVRRRQERQNNDNAGSGYENRGRAYNGPVRRRRYYQTDSGNANRADNY